MKKQGIPVWTWNHKVYHLPIHCWSYIPVCTSPPGIVESLFFLAAEDKASTAHRRCSYSAEEYKDHPNSPQIPDLEWSKLLKFLTELQLHIHLPLHSFSLSLTPTFWAFINRNKIRPQSFVAPTFHDIFHDHLLTHTSLQFVNSHPSLWCLVSFVIQLQDQGCS